jgi:hypothetical protein
MRQVQRFDEATGAGNGRGRANAWNAPLESCVRVALVVAGLHLFQRRKAEA